MGYYQGDDYYSDYSGPQIDNLLGKTVWQTNPNLLDNWYFVGGGSQQGGGQFPINQRGQTRYSGGSYTYGIDRWKTFSYAVPLELTQAGIYIAKTASSFVMHQVYSSPLIIGEKYTLSMLTSGGLYKHTFKASSYDISDGRILTNQTRAQFWFSGESQTDVTLIACKLELGDQQTLAHQDANGNWVLNEIPNYQEQLFRCLTSHADPDDTMANNEICVEKEVVIPLSTFGSSITTAPRFVGYCSVLFGIHGSKIASLMLSNLQLNPTAICIWTIYSDELYVCATTSTTLSTDVTAHIIIADL